VPSLYPATSVTFGNILRTAFPDFHADIHWQLADGDRVTTYKTYHGTHRGEFLGVAVARKIQFETVDVMRVRNGKITEHWGRKPSATSNRRRGDRVNDCREPVPPRGGTLPLGSTIGQKCRMTRDCYLRT
jgi:SnoaL-like polyketide cyclase